MDNPRREAMSVDHYENFPVASWLCPPALRPAVRAIYWVARTADDLADEGDASAPERLAALAEYRADLQRALAGDVQGRWQGVFAPLADAVARHALPVEPLTDLLSAFEQDVRNPVYPDRAALLDYCARSANPVGRLLLHLYGEHDAQAQAESDAVCSALQLINFWQDLSVDLPRGRCYVPQADAARHGLAIDDLRAGSDTPATRELVRGLCDWARALMHRGAPLVHRLPGRAGWELRAVVQGGLAILDNIRRMDHRALSHRPTLGAPDWLRIAWRVLRMRPGAR
jgi:squalene synthase HpnC